MTPGIVTFRENTVAVTGSSCMSRVELSSWQEKYLVVGGKTLVITERNFHPPFQLSSLQINSVSFEIH